MKIGSKIAWFALFVLLLMSLSSAVVAIGVGRRIQKGKEMRESELECDGM
jgi:hypothetical protein